MYVYGLAQILRYGPTNKYGAHLDGLGRVMSVLIYLVGGCLGLSNACAEACMLHLDACTTPLARIRTWTCVLTACRSPGIWRRDSLP